MSKTFKLAAVAALCAVAAAAHAEVKFDANIEFDTTYTDARSNPVAKSSTDLGGRVELNANAELARNGDYFVNGRASLIVPVNGNEVHMDDAWLQFGSSQVDFKLGRFEAVDLFPLGMDTVVMPADGTGYRANMLRGRVTDGRFHGALGFNAAPGLRFEVGMVAEKAGNENASGFRPAVVYSQGDLTLRAGLEALQNNAVIPGADSTGVGLSVGYALAKDTMINANYAHNNKLDATSVGANAVIGALGLGYVQDKTGSNSVDTVYAAYKLPLLGVKGAFITPALSFSKGDKVDDLVAFRVRLNYQF
ncbi:MAG: carbohydrate porin [Burkholderiales bacterium]|nr:carbohydrate porin [Burkholderiales bacterium]